MKQTVQFFRELAKRHRQLAGELHNEELIRDLHRLADECEAKAEGVMQQLKSGESRGPWSTRPADAQTSVLTGGMASAVHAAWHSGSKAVLEEQLGAGFARAGLPSPRDQARQIWQHVGSPAS